MTDFTKRIVRLRTDRVGNARLGGPALLDATCGRYPIRRKRLLPYGIAIVATTLATLVRYWLDPILEDSVPFTTYYAAVVFVAWYAGWRQHCWRWSPAACWPHICSPSLAVPF